MKRVGATACSSSHRLTGASQTIALIEQGGGYDATQMSACFAAKNIHRTGTLQAVSVGGASTTPDGDASGADGEVQLDIHVAGPVAPAGNLAVYFGNNTGGGFSAHFTRPDWQSGSTQTGRGVPDVAGNADSQTGCNVAVEEQATVIRGTSTVAALWAGLITLVNQSAGGNAGFVNPLCGMPAPAR